VSVIAHTGYDNDDNKYPQNHIKVKVSATAAVVAYRTAVTHNFASFHKRFKNRFDIYYVFL